jgi:hypothetical protein
VNPAACKMFAYYQTKKTHTNKRGEKKTERKNREKENEKEKEKKGGRKIKDN